MKKAGFIWAFAVVLCGLSRAQANSDESHLHSSKYLLKKADSLSQLGATKRKTGEFLEAFSAYYEAHSIIEKIGTKGDLLAATENLGTIYRDVRDYEDAKTHMLEMLKLSRELGDSAKVADAYSNLLFLAILQKRRLEANNYRDKCQASIFNLADTREQEKRYIDLAWTYYLVANCDSALLFLHKSLRNDPENIGHISYPKHLQGHCYCWIDKLDSAFILYKQTLNRAKSEKSWSAALLAYDALIYYHKRIDDYETAFTYFEQKGRFEDSVDLVGKALLTQRLKAQYEIDRRDSQLAEMERQKELEKLKAKQAQYQSLLLAVLIVFLIAAGIVSYFLFKQRHKLLRLKLQNRLLTVQINPHFIGNTLMALQELVLYQKTEEAVNYIAKLASLMRTYLNISHHAITSIEEEFKALKSYLEIQKLRFDEKLQYELNIEGVAHLKNEPIPPMVLQPIVENAVEHGIKKSGSVSITVDVLEKKNGVEILIKDNGPGLEEDNAQLSSQKGVSMTIVRKHIKEFNKLKKADIRLVSENILENNVITGACVKLFISHKETLQRA